MKKYLLAILLLSGLVLVFLSKNKSPKVTHVVCRTQFGECPERYSQILGVTVDRKQIEDILNQLVDVKTAEFVNKSSGALEVLITQRTPLGVINGLVADESGKLYTQVSDSALPRLSVDKAYEVGQDIAPVELEALKTLVEVSGIVSDRFSSKLIDNSLFLTLDLGTEIIINVDSLNMRWSKPLQHILARSKIEGRVPRRIDLRFNNPVITF